MVAQLSYGCNIIVLTGCYLILQVTCLIICIHIHVHAQHRRLFVKTKLKKKDSTIIGIVPCMFNAMYEEDMPFHVLKVYIRQVIETVDGSGAAVKSLTLHCQSADGHPT